MKLMTAMYTFKRGGSYDRFKMMLEAFLEREWEVHCLSLTRIHIEHPLFYNHVLYFPFKKADSFMGKLWVLSLCPLWSVWIGWRKGIDLIIAFGLLYAFILSFSKCFLKKKMVTLIRGDSHFSFQIKNSYKYTLSLNRGIENIGLYFSDRIITNNTAFQDMILKRLGNRNYIEVRVLFNHIPFIPIPHLRDISKTRAQYRISGDAKILVTAGILNRGKNIEVLIRCLPKIKMKSLHLFIIGDSSTEADFQYKEFLKTLVKEWKVEEQVSFVGWIEKEELWNIYLASDLFILPSLSEGMPNAMLEALGAGLPSIGSNIPGIKDALHYDDLLFDPVDEKNLTDQIQKFFSDKLFSDKVKGLCEKRKDLFCFDWKENLFQMVTEGLKR